MNRRILLAGCGYVGSHLAQSEIQAGSQVLALVKSAESAEGLRNQNIQARAINLDDAVNLPVSLSEGIDLLYYFIAPQPSGKEDLRSRNFIKLCKGRSIRQVVLISTTGVYGDCQGQWIDESRFLAPKVDRAWRRVSAEHQWRDFADSSDTVLTVLRVAGIYGPGKLPLARLKRQEPVLARKESPWSNRIYSKDLVRICQAAGNKAYNGVINVADDEPGTMTDYFFRIADSFGLTRPQEISLSQAKAQMSEGMWSYLRESRRINNARLKKVLDINLQYPALDQGLADILQASRAEKI